jgi:small subunit ribosomal protein S17
MGDIVKIVETRPLSKEKRWRVAEIVSKGEMVEVQPKEIE